jgi:ribosomal-protein-alanine N-acetyltransferase
MFDLTYFHPIFDTFPVLETERLVLREMDLSDIEDVYQIYAEPEVTRYYDLDTFTNLEQAEALITRQQARFQKKEGIRWGITFKDENVVVGTIGMMIVAHLRLGGIGYDLGRPYWRRGIMSEALQVVIGFGFEQARVERIQALVMPGNEASGKLLEKLGFVDKGILREHAFFKGEFQDLHNFILEKSGMTPPISTIVT